MAEGLKRRDEWAKVTGYEDTGGTSQSAKSGGFTAMTQDPGTKLEGCLLYTSGLPETATDAEITAKLNELNAAKQEHERLQKEKETLTLASITAVVEKAVGEKRIATDKKDEFINLGKEIGQETLERIISCLLYTSRCV